MMITRSKRSERTCFTVFDLHKRYTIAMPVGIISDSGITEITNFISSQRLTSDAWRDRNGDDLTHMYLPPLPRDWQYQWVITGRGEYVGTFPKRVSKYYYQAHSIKCPNEFVAELGQIARRNSAVQTSHLIDFTDDLNWRAGDFGDNGSCLWGSNSHGREIMQENGVFAIRFFYKEDDGKGRAWMYELRDEIYILWNGYGVKGGTIAIARIFAHFQGLSYKKITLTNHGADGGLVWINGGTGYVIGHADAIADTDDYDLAFGVPYECYDCGDELREDDIYRTPDDDMMCQDCFYSVAGFCDECGETHWRDDMTYTANDREVCERCLDRHYTRCDKCEEYHPDDEMRTKGDTLTLCEGCLE